MGEEAFFLGQVVNGRFTVESIVGAGAFSYVFEATDARSRATVAVKVLKPLGTMPDSAESEFRNEAVLLAKLHRATNVVDLLAPQAEATLTVYAAGSTAAVPVSYLYFVLECMDCDASTRLPGRDELSWSDRLAILRGAVKGVQQMHRLHIYHRDLKATNVLLRLVGPTTFLAKVGDLGRSRDMREPASARDEAYAVGRGDMNHRPPECAFGAGGTTERDFLRGDLYLLGSLLFELATGNPLTRTCNFRTREWLVPPEGGMAAEICYRWNIPQIRAVLHDILGGFDETLPLCVRERSGRLIRQLCDPDPEKREPTWKLGSKHKPPVGRPGLDWLIREIDILVHILDHQPANLRDARATA